MGFTDWAAKLFGGGVKDTLDGVGNLAIDIRTAITGDAPLTGEQKTRITEQLNMIESAAKQRADELDRAVVEGANAVNLADANSGSNFRGGWRPFIGWTCGAGLCYQYLFRTIVPWGVQSAGWMFGKEMASFPVPPSLEVEQIVALIVPMLGLGAYRTYEKTKGTK